MRTLALSKSGVMAGRFRRRAEEILERAGVTLNGTRPWDIQVHDERLYARVFAQGPLGLGEAYMDGWWDCDALDEFFARTLRADLQRAIRPWSDFFEVLRAKLLNLQRPSRAHEIGRRHYDVGNDLYEHMLDKRMIYSCAYWKDANDLDQAQEAKLDLVCRKLRFEPGMTVLDIGCGWGGTARFAVERYGVSVVGVTVSEEQVKLARERCAGLPIEIRLQDYREVEGKFDRVLSLGMFEHVGYKNYRRFMRVVRRCLRDDGLFLLQTIGGNVSVKKSNRWIDTYIFPNSMVPSITQIGRATEGLFVMEDWHNFGADYDRTVMAWLRNFETAWPELRERYGERFYRMWRFYLCSSAGFLRSRTFNLWQIVFSPRGVPGGYVAPR